MASSPPLANELEVSVFGPGVGECIVCHVGDGAWIIVDSCVDRGTGNPIALDYLASLGVDVARQVKLIVATHWHDDHIQGLAAIFEASKSARFVNSATHVLKDLLALVRIGNIKAPQSSGTREYGAVLDILEQRGPAAGIINALANKKLLTLAGVGRTVNADIIALSPADATFNVAAAELRSAFSAVEAGHRPPSRTPNQLSAALWVKMGALDAILGADLEHRSEPNEGWNAVVFSAERPRERAGFFKVPHHGSQGADCPACWTDLLADSPVAIMTAYSPSTLPRPQDKERLCARTKEVYLTSDPGRYPLPRRDGTVERTLREVANRRRALTGKMGHVCFRASAVDVGVSHTLQTYNGAHRVCT